MCNNCTEEESPASLVVIREMQSHAMRYHFLLSTLAGIKRVVTIWYCEDLEMGLKYC